MYLTAEQERMLNGEAGYAVQKAMEILTALGDIYGAERLIRISSVQVAGVSYHNLGDAGLEWLKQIATDGRVRVLTTLNPAGMDLENWQELGIDRQFAQKQIDVIRAYASLGVIPACTCTPYLAGNLPIRGQHIAWSESSAVIFANSVIGAYTNREGGPSALAAALTGFTPEYGLHIEANRVPDVTIEVEAKIESKADWGALGYAVGQKAPKAIVYLKGVHGGLDELKAYGAAAVTYGTKPLFYIERLHSVKPPSEKIAIEQSDLKSAYEELNDSSDVDFVGLGCPHASIGEVAEIVRHLKGRRVNKTTWLCMSRATKMLADACGYTEKLKKAGVQIACDTCMAVAPLKGRFKCMATNSAKMCFYARGHNAMACRLMSVKECIETALKRD